MVGMDVQGQGVVTVGTPGTTTESDSPAPDTHTSTLAPTREWDGDRGTVERDEKGRLTSEGAREMASLRAAYRESRSGISPHEKAQRAVAGLGQRDWDALVRTLTQTASGAGVLVRLLDAVSPAPAKVEGGEGDERALTTEEREAVLDALVAQAQSSRLPDEEGKEGEDVVS